MAATGPTYKHTSPDLSVNTLLPSLHKIQKLFISVHMLEFSYWKSYSH